MLHPPTHTTGEFGLYGGNGQSYLGGGAAAVDSFSNPRHL